MKETYADEICNYLLQFGSQLKVRVVNKKEGLEIEGNARKENQYLFVNETSFKIEDQNDCNNKRKSENIFYADYPTVTAYNVIKECITSGGSKKKKKKIKKSIQQKKKGKNKKISLNILHNK